MDGQNGIQLFEDQQIRTAWDAEREEWYFSIVDVCGVLSDTDNPRRYWSDLKRKLKAEGSELYEKIVQLKMKAEDGKSRLTDVADTELVLTMLAEASTRDISEKPEGFDQSKRVAKRGGSVARVAREALEAETGQSVVTSQNAAQMGTVVTELIESVASEDEKK